MVQATLEIYKNTLWGSDVEIEIYLVVILWKPNRTPPFFRMDVHGGMAFTVGGYCSQQLQ